MAIPVIDFQALSEEGLEPDGYVVEQFHSAFSTVGFVFITSHGIDRKLVRFTQKCLGTSKALPTEVEDR